MTLAVFVAAGLAAVALGAIPSDEVTSLPGWTGPLPSKHYSGLMNIPGSQKMAHYWFVEAETNPATAPLFLWLNGGPGCSSLDGLLYEQGPIHVNEANTSQLLYNPYTWTKLVNMIFLESPTGVGFSFSPNPADLITNDTQSAQDNFLFLTAWFAAYPEYAANDFYLSGESYAGVYVPMLAQRITVAAEAGEATINLKGFMVGNGCTGSEIGICGYYFSGLGQGRKMLKDFLSGHALMSMAVSQELDSLCGDYNTPTPQCLEAFSAMQDTVGSVNAYDIYTPCIKGGDVAVPFEHSRSRVTSGPGAPSLTGPVDCIDGIAAATWINTPEVIQALHVEAAMPYVKTWTICSGSIKYSKTATNLPATIYPELISLYRVLVYNGDVDACVPWEDNAGWTSGLNYTEQSAWHPWLLENQVGGYATVYTVPNAPHTFTFVTVKGSGHMVPEYQPASALEMLTRFVNNTPF